MQTKIIKITKKGVRYGIGLIPMKVWIDIWKPKWHKNRGYYISIGLFFVALYRGY